MTNVEETPVSENRYDVQYFRDQIAELLKSSGKKLSHRNLAIADPFYSTSDGYIHLNRVRIGKGSLGPTQRAYYAFVKYLESQNIPIENAKSLTAA